MQPEAVAPVIADRYRLGEPLGHGAVGDVFAADDLRLGRPVAVKILRPEMAASDTARRRFEEEARAAARIMHPNVVAVFDTGEHDGTAFIVMERLPGRTMADEMRNGPLPVERACELAGQILAALEAAHAEGVLHRDIKPGNVMITASGDAKVGDFGIAKAVETPDVTVTGALLGTPAYLSPERISGEPATPESDLYAVGVVLYEAIAGRKPFRGDGPMALAHAIVHGEPEALASICPDLDPRIVAAVEQAMAKEPARRFRRAVDMARALSGERAALHVVGPPPTDAPTVVDEPTTVDPAPGRSALLGDDATSVERDGPPVLVDPEPRGALPALPPVLRGWGSRHAAVLLLIAVLAVLAVVGVGAALSGDDDPPPSTDTSEASVPPELDEALDGLEEAVQP